MSQQADPLIIDVDTGIDDALALLYACAQPAAGSSASRPSSATSACAATRNTRAVLALAGRGDIPVWPGAASPLSPASADARRFTARAASATPSCPSRLRPVEPHARGRRHHRGGPCALRAGSSWSRPGR